MNQPVPAQPAQVPVLALGDVLLVSLQGELHDGMAEQLQHDITDRIATSRVTGVVIDISGVDIVDSFLGRVLAEIASTARLLAARTVLAGMRPAVAITLVELGLALPGLVTALDVDRAMELLSQGDMMQSSGHASATSLPIGSDADLAWVRQEVRQCAAQLGFGLVQQTKLVTAASELARNTLVHGGGGRAEITPLHNGRARGLKMCFVDSGPGIRDLEMAMTDGYTTGGGLGLGMSGAKRLVHEFSVDTEPGRGTTVTAVAWVTQVPSSRPGVA